MTSLTKKKKLIGIFIKKAQRNQKIKAQTKPRPKSLFSLCHVSSSGALSRRCHASPCGSPATVKPLAAPIPSKPSSASPARSHVHVKPLQLSRRSRSPTFDTRPTCRREGHASAHDPPVSPLARQMEPTCLHVCQICPPLAHGSRGHAATRPSTPQPPHVSRPRSPVSPLAQQPCRRA